MASRRNPPPRPERPHHSAQEKSADIAAIERRIAEVEAFDPAAITARFTDPNVRVLQTAIDETLSDVFGHATDDYRRYAGAARLDDGPLSMEVPSWGGRGGGGLPEAVQAQRYIAEGKQKSLALLKQAVRRLKEEIEREVALAPARAVGAAPAVPVAAASAMSRTIFIVHGHDEAMREAVARFIEQLGFEAVILHEQANRGQTLIEKFESHGEAAGFAIVLLSADDEGRADDGAVTARARQNVVLELGYFYGKLGRKRVCALKRGEIELPSDFVGVVYESFDDAGAWKAAVARELQAAGYNVDWNVVMRR